MEGLESEQRRAAELGKRLEHKADEQQLRVFFLEKRKLREKLIALCSSLEGGCSWVGIRPLLPGSREQRERTGPGAATGRFSVDVRRNSSLKGWSDIGTEVTVPGGV